jgi:chemotaxis protein CheX
MNTRLNDAITRATGEILKDMLRLKVTHEPATEKPINQTNGVCSDTTSIISFVGDISGALMLKCSKQVSTKIASMLLDTEVHPDSEEMKDAIGELLNMIIGSAKTYYSQVDSFTISVPTTIVGKNFSLYVKANTGNTVAFILFKSGTAKIGLEIYLS